jgi:hypothetical protein
VKEGFEEPAALLIPDHLMKGPVFIRTPSWRMLKAAMPEAGEDLQVFDRLRNVIFDRVMTPFS